MAYINCKDGFEFSIAWHPTKGGLYCKVEHVDGIPVPVEVEVREDSMAKERRDPILETWIQDWELDEENDCVREDGSICRSDRIAGNVPIEVIHALIDRHGGIEHRTPSFLYLLRTQFAEIV